LCKRPLGRKLPFRKGEKMTVSKTIPTELLDTLLLGYQKPEELIGENGLLNTK